MNTSQNIALRSAQFTRASVKQIREAGTRITGVEAEQIENALATLEEVATQLEQHAAAFEPDTSDVARLRAQLNAIAEREAAVCPEDVGFDEWIGVLNKRLLMLAKLAAPTPQFFGPVAAWEAEKLRDQILAAALAQELK